MTTRDGNAFSTAYTKNFYFDGERQIPASQWNDGSSWYWQGRASNASRRLFKELTAEEWDAFWDAVSDDADSRKIAQLIEAELTRRYEARIEAIKRRTTGA